MVICKIYKSELVVKNGFIRGKQRFHRTDYGLDFIESDAHANKKIAAKKGMCVLYIFGQDFFQYARPYFRWKLEPNFRKTVCLMRQDKWNLMKCGILSAQKKNPLAHQGKLPWHTENCGLGARHLKKCGTISLPNL
ncbi:MAG: hypothetical protein LBS77_04925 [Desulfovibrio sp.]|nr:hypothetical protein [Desulfovibrio sp.]